MDDSFRVRVDRVFGSLNTTTPAGVSPASWCLADGKIERREWRRNKDDDDDVEEEELKEERPEHRRSDDIVSRSFASEDQFESDLQELSGSEEDEEEKGNEEDIVGKKSVELTGGDAADEFMNIQAIIGRDCTLDREEEEDEYDKVAVGKDHSGDRLYMKDVKYSDYGLEEFTVNSELPNSFHSGLRDPRANHEAAKARLKEDAETAGDFDNLQLSDNSFATLTDTKDQTRVSELDVEKPKPILKRKENPTDSRSRKRVRFTLDINSSAETNEGKQLQEVDDDLVSEPGSADNGAFPEQTSSDLSEYVSGVPDYIRNPSRYTRYTFDSTDDLDDQSNRKAYTDLFNHLRKNSGDERSTTENEVPGNIPKTIVFTPRKKSEAESMMTKNENEGDAREHDGKNKGPSTVFEADEAQVDKASAMEEDEQPVMTSKQKQSRHYRIKTNVDLDEDDDMRD